MIISSLRAKDSTLKSSWPTFSSLCNFKSIHKGLDASSRLLSMMMTRRLVSCTKVSSRMVSWCSSGMPSPNVPYIYRNIYRMFHTFGYVPYIYRMYGTFANFETNWHPFVICPRTQCLFVPDPGSARSSESGKSFWIMWPSTDQCNIHWKPIMMTQLWMNHSWISTWVTYCIKALLLPPHTT